MRGEFPLIKTILILFLFSLSASPAQSRKMKGDDISNMIIEGENRLYATQGEDKCQVESLVQETLPASPGSPGIHDYRIAARGFCVDPATSLDGSARLYINRFDFAGIARFEDNDLHAPTPATVPTPATPTIAAS